MCRAALGCATVAIIVIAGPAMTLARDSAHDRSVESDHAQSRTLAKGLVVDDVEASIPSTVDAGDGIITMVRIDPALYRFHLLTAAAHGARTAPQWAREFKLTGVINASMFQPNQRSTGLMVDGAQLYNATVNSSFGAFFAFDAVESDAPRVGLFGRGCPGFDVDRIRESFRVVIQNYRMLNCDGRPIPWKDPKIYSVAAVAIDRDGWVVFIHSRTPYRMRDFNAMISDPKLGLTAAMFVEGGPEASLFVTTDKAKIERTGSWESGFRPDDSNQWFRRIPNVIGFSPLAAAEPDAPER